MKVKASCSTCGVHLLEVTEVTIVIYPRKVELNFYEFTCPVCSERVSGTCAAGSLVQMHQEGAPRRIIVHPLEVLEGCPILPSLTQDDVLDFMLDIEREDYLAPLAQ